MHPPYSQEQYKKNVRKIWTTTAILSAVTIFEVALAVVFHVPYALLAFLVSVISLIKAYYIMSIFMHLGDETKGFKYSALFPFMFLIWGFVAFALDGASFQGMREALNIVLTNWSF